jgi:peptidoglycan-associated lipoprotein
MRIPSILLSLGLIMIISNEIYSQNKRLQRAYETYEAGEYYQAVDIFKDAYQKITDKKEKERITFYIAECYRKIDDPKQASLWYKKVLSKNPSNAEAVLHNAEMLKMLGEYEEARQQFKTY